jgi:hypothetical protein
VSLLAAIARRPSACIAEGVKEAGMLDFVLASLLIGLVDQDVVSGRSFLSPPLARDVVRLMESRALRGFAVEDATGPGRFVAAVLAGNQLLVLEASHPAPALIARQIAARRYRAAYFELRRAPVPGKFIVRDVGADGLLTLNREPVDVVFENGHRRTFDGSLSDDEPSHGEYNRWFAAADERYAYVLTALKRALERRSKIG